MNILTSIHHPDVQSFFGQKALRQRGRKIKSQTVSEVEAESIMCRVRGAFWPHVTASAVKASGFESSTFPEMKRKWSDIKVKCQEVQQCALAMLRCHWRVSVTRASGICNRTSSSGRETDLAGTRVQNYFFSCSMSENKNTI